ncbi:cytochrome P450 [Aspergillus stella-maris]|uniref:cytochrome P450 n=1 Tax=Aspergillus stella-maris TaxID=1810926 RepID=UPI003CCC9AFE
MHANPTVYPSHYIKDPETGRAYPTEGCLVWPISVGLHRHAATWGPDSSIFRPTRFLETSAKSASMRDAFVPFSRGPRNCIGQDLAMTEAKIILALSIREFDFSPAFA